MTRKTSKKSIFLGIAGGVGAVLVMVCIFVFVLCPQRRRIVDVEGRIGEVKGLLVRQRTNGGNGEAVKLEEEISSAQEVLRRYVVSPEQASDLSFDINRIATEIGVHDLRSTNRTQDSYGAINECRHVREGRILIDFKSSFSQFARFINSLERNKPVIFVDEFDIKRSKDDAIGAHDVTMVLTFFVGQDSLKDILAAGNSADQNQTVQTEPAL